SDVNPSLHKLFAPVRPQSDIHRKTQVDIYRSPRLIDGIHKCIGLSLQRTQPTKFANLRDATQCFPLELPEMSCLGIHPVTSIFSSTQGAPQNLSSGQDLLDGQWRTPGARPFAQHSA